MTKAVIQLETLTCPSCVKKIESALNRLEGVNSVKVLFNSSKVKAEFDASQVSVDKIKETIIKLGYEVLSSKIS